MCGGCSSLLPSKLQKHYRALTAKQSEELALLRILPRSFARNASRAKAGEEPFTFEVGFSLYTETSFDSQAALGMFLLPRLARDAWGLKCSGQKRPWTHLFVGAEQDSCWCLVNCTCLSTPMIFTFTVMPRSVGLRIIPNSLVTQAGR